MTKIQDRGRFALPVALIASLALAASGCGSDEKSSDSSDASTTAPTTTAESGAKPATGAPILIQVESAVDTQAANYPGVFSGAKAAAKAVNDRGGVNGRPLKLITCNDQLTPNGAAACARKAISNKVVAQTGLGVLTPVTLPILRKAGIPVSQWSVNQSDVSAEGVYPVGAGGTVTEYVGLPFAAKRAGAKSAAIVVADFPGVLEGVEGQKKAAESIGLKITKEVTTSLTQTNLAPAVQQLAASKPDAVLMSVAAPQIPALLTAARAINFRPTWVAVGSFTPSALEAASKLTDDLWLSLAAPAFVADDFSDIPAVVQYREEMNAQEESGDKDAGKENRDAVTFHSWASLHAMALALEDVKGTISAKTLTAELDKAQSIDVLGIYDWKPGTQGPEGWTRITDGGRLFIGPVKDAVFTPAARISALTEAGYE